MVVVLLMAVAYLLIFILGATSGIIHPACYAYIGALLPVAFALMKPVIANIPMLVVALVVTIPVAILAMRLAERILKKRAEKLK